MRRQWPTGHERFREGVCRRVREVQCDAYAPPRQTDAGRRLGPIRTLEVCVKNLFAVTLGLLLAATVRPADAQWLNRRTPNIPRTANGTPDLSAPAPRGADGHPDLSGV